MFEITIDQVTHKTLKEFSSSEIRAIVSRYADAALRVKNTGFDMVELHGGTGYLLSQFLSLRTNKRADEYGGSFENRKRYARSLESAGIAYLSVMGGTYESFFPPDIVKKSEESGYMVDLMEA